MWDERYSEPGFAYGREANEFLADVVKDISVGRALCLAAGEGRNAVFLANNRFDVTAVDRSVVGLAKAQALAAEHNVSIDAQCADLADYELGESGYDLIVSIFAHVPADVRRLVHARVIRALRPGGTFVLEAYTPAQLGRGTGGPPSAGMMMTADALSAELGELDIMHLDEIEREVREGRCHTGAAAVVQLVARRPKMGASL